MKRIAGLMLAAVLGTGCGIIEEKGKPFPNDCGGMNDFYGAATAVPAEEGFAEKGLDLCPNETDWYEIQVDPGQYLYFEVTFEESGTDLTLDVFDGNEKRLNRSDSGLGYERLAVLGPDGDLPSLYVIKVSGYQGSSGKYDLAIRSFDYVDGKDCTGDDCKRIMQFPAPMPSEHYRFDSYAEYQNARRELIMLVRFAIAKTWEKYPDQTPLGLIDMSERNGDTPGSAYDEPRHPEGTHVEGNDMDIAYFQTGPDNRARTVCPDDGYYCTSDENTMNAEVQAYFMAQLFSSNDVRVIGCDTRLEDDIVAAAEALAVAGDISTAQRSKFSSRVASGEGWPFHQHHIHLSLNWDEGYESRMANGSSPYWF